MVLFPAPEGPTRAVNEPAAAVKETSRNTGSLESTDSSRATDSRDARETSAAVGYVKLTESNSTPRAPDGNPRGSAGSRTNGSRSRTSNTRSKDTSAVMTSTRTLLRAVSGPYSCASRATRASRVPKVMAPWITKFPPRP